MSLCKCGCGQLTKGHLDHGDHGKHVVSSYLPGHNRRGYKATEETIQRLRDSHKGQVSHYKGKKATPEIREKLRLSHLGIIPTKETLKKRSNSLKNTWRTATEANKSDWVQKIKKGMLCFPNKPETAILSILDSLYPGEWKYVGDGDVVMAGKCPDFINVNGQKKIIELFGDYWHRGQSAEDRAAIFEPFGYETLVIWERELKDVDSVKNRIERFCEHGN